MAPSGWASGLAALLITMSTPPKASTVRSTRRPSSSSRPTWVGTARADPPAARIASTVSSHASAFRLATTTWAPIAANPTATARPMPRLPPVTTATRSRRSKASSGEGLTGPDRFPPCRSVRSRSCPLGQRAHVDAGAAPFEPTLVERPDGDVVSGRFGPECGDGRLLLGAHGERVEGVPATGVLVADHVQLAVRHVGRHPG